MDMGRQAARTTTIGRYYPSTTTKGRHAINKKDQQLELEPVKKL
jgi:hypothetical protein